MARITRSIWRGRVLCVLYFWLAVSPAHAQSCRHALVLALDVSGSVNPTEYAQQVNGLASALNDRDVRAMILSGSDAPVSLAVFEWSSRNHQYVIQPWISLNGPAALDTAIARIRSHRKVRAGLRTALGTALGYGAAMLENRSHCWKHTIDVSGDGKNNIGTTPRDYYRLPAFDGITVNALVVGDPSDGEEGEKGVSRLILRNYFETEVIFGPNAFAMIANGYADYARAMRLKLMRELAPLVIGKAVVPARPRTDKN